MAWLRPGTGRTRGLPRKETSPPFEWAHGRTVAGEVGLLLSQRLYKVSCLCPTFSSGAFSKAIPCSISHSPPLSSLSLPFLASSCVPEFPHYRSRPHLHLPLNTVFPKSMPQLIRLQFGWGAYDIGFFQMAGQRPKLHLANHFFL